MPPREDEEGGEHGRRRADGGLLDAQHEHLDAELADEPVDQREHRGDPEREQRRRDAHEVERQEDAGEQQDDREHLVVADQRGQPIPATTPPTVPTTRPQPRVSRSPRLFVPANTTNAAITAQYQRDGAIDSLPAIASVAATPTCTAWRV